MKSRVAISLALASFFCGISPAGAQFQNLKMQGASMSFKAGDAWVKVGAVSDSIIHVQFGLSEKFLSQDSFSVLPNLPLPARGSSGINGGGFVINAGKVSAQIDTRSGAVTFLDGNKNPILAEVPGSHAFEKTTVLDQAVYHVRQQWEPGPDEAFFGLGQHQFGLTNIRDYDIDLWQHNTEIAVPLLVSSKGYGILWDNNSLTKFGDPRDFAKIPADHLFDAQGNPGGFTRTSFSDAGMTQQTAQRVEADIANGGQAGGGARGRGGNAETAVRWEGEVQSDAAGLYKFQLYANGGYKMWIDGNLVADHWRQNWLPWNDLASVRFEAGTRHKIKLEWIKDGGTYCTLTWKPPLPGDPGNISLWSQAGEGIDYYFIYGGAAADKATGKTPIDNVIAGYRLLTGKAPMMPSWAFGLWQSRQRYETQQASLDVVKGFRDRQIPFDNIVQDWMYWRQDDWGSHNFDPQRFPNPDQWVKDIHAMNAHVMISVWGKFYPTTDNYKALNDKGYMYPVYPVRDWVGRGYPFAFYDAFNPDARAMFWQQVNDRLFSKGFDAWWMDATEPDLTQPSPPILENQQKAMAKTAAGPGLAVMNAYPLLNSQAVYEGQRKAAPDQRVFILTRSGYVGQQRYAAASWSGDISSTWTAMRKQIAAGLGYSISGLPYWTMDCGGFSVPAKFNNQRDPVAVDEWRELNARWFEFAAFVPLLRVHGEAPLREMWQFGGETSDAYKAMLKADRLRYRLFPYIYSLAGQVTQNDATFMRPLVMDFPNDTIARDINDQYMFGPAFMVCPVTQYKARTRSVYLPFLPLKAGMPIPRSDIAVSPGWLRGPWYDFWAGTFANAIAGSSPDKERLDCPAPYDQIPLFVPAGSIIPFGPDLQYIAEKKSAPLTLYVYTGADGDFTLYEDDGLTYQYEKNAFSQIPLHWNQSTQTLTLAKRQGSFPNMLATRTIQVIFITPQKTVPYSFDLKPDKTVKYTGDEISIKP